MTHVSLIFLCFAPLIACGYSSIGGGNNAIEVIAAIVYNANDDQSDAVVTVFDANMAPITNAIITLIDGDGSDALIPMELSNDDRYRGTARGYLRRIEIEVTTGDARVAGRIEAPAPHTVSRPKNTSTRKVSRDLPIVWATIDGMRADHVVIELSQAQFSTILIDDRGFYAIPNIFLRVGDDNLAIRRQNSIVLAGGIRASSFTVGYQVDTDITILAE